MFLGAVYAALMTAMPLMHALSPAKPTRAPLAALPAFEQLDGNGDGFIDTKEAAALPGLRAALEQAGISPHAKIDKVRFARALALLDARSDTRP